jgi:hypothetical protein
VENWKVKTSPLPSDPLLKPGALPVTLCVKLSLFVHLTVVPAGTVMLDGVNAIFCNHTSFTPGVPVSVELLEQLSDIMKIVRTIPMQINILFFGISNFFMTSSGIRMNKQILFEKVQYHRELISCDYQLFIFD